jgi:predicted DNA-binding ribbon-helix-helix protein
MSGLRKRSFTLAGHRTSVALEPEFWVALESLAAARGETLLALIARVDAGRAGQERLASTLRVLCLREARGES